MKRIALDNIFLTPKSLMTALVILTLFIFSMLATAAQSDTADTGGQAQAERFNHMSTGFVLSGAHAIAECGSCHVGGVFKGTPRNCIGCHTKGQRVVATAKSSTHLVTTEPCEVCHTNTVTFLGARYNHGMAVPGQCTTCHNGSVATGRATSHKTGNKLTKSCDSCHRTTAWLPATWNHNGIVAGCVTCHVAGGEGATFVRQVTGTTQERFAHAYTSISSCESCHTSYYSWYGAIYDHAGAGASPSCSGCHGITATGTAQFTGHTSVGTNECSACHTTTRTWLGALGAMPVGHIPASLFSPTSISCGTCHPTASTWLTGASMHSHVSSPCEGCHLSGTNITGASQKSHNRSQACASCHSSYTSWSR